MFEELFSQFLLLAGYAALVAVVINVGKMAGFISETGKGWFTAVRASAILNILGFAGFVYLKVVHPEIDISSIDETLNVAAGWIVGFLMLLAQLKVSPFVHDSIAGLPLVGKQFTK
jgi:hypothetical protein